MSRSERMIHPPQGASSGHVAKPEPGDLEAVPYPGLSTREEIFDDVRIRTGQSNCPRHRRLTVRTWSRSALCGPRAGSFDAMIDHLNAVVLPVRDLEKCSSFYSSKLGFKLKNKDENSAFFGIGDREGVILGLISIDNVAELISEEEVRPREETIHRTYYAVFVDDVDREYQDLKRKGVHFVKPPTTQPWGQRIAYFEDPEGNLWEISHFSKK